MSDAAARDPSTGLGRGYCVDPVVGRSDDGTLRLEAWGQAALDCRVQVHRRLRQLTRTVDSSTLEVGDRVGTLRITPRTETVEILDHEVRR